MPVNCATLHHCGSVPLPAFDQYVVGASWDADHLLPGAMRLRVYRPHTMRFVHANGLAQRLRIPLWQGLAGGPLGGPIERNS